MHFVIRNHHLCASNFYPYYLFCMKKLIFFTLLLFFSVNVFAQVKPRLVVGIVVDQMRWDYLYRYQDRYTDGGFKRLLREGFSCENTLIPYTPTYTAAGHACIYTGSVPAINGIVGNAWYDRELKRTVYCTDDASVQGVGSTSEAGLMSPRNMWTSTVGDELRLATNFRSKTIAIALKDRGAILPGGHMANAAYWFDNASGGWISSTYYMNDLPAWVKQFNAKKIPDQLMAKNWSTLYPLNTYQQSTNDTNSYEGRLPGGGSVFPHNTSAVTQGKYDAFRTTPFGSTYTMLMAKEAVKAEHLGQGKETDFLSVSFSSPDYIGHTFGLNSVEIEDTYLRLDKDIAELLTSLDKQVGKGQYLLFLTADHGAAHSPGFITDNKGAARVFPQTDVDKQLRTALEEKFGVSNLIQFFYNSQFFLNDSLLSANKLDRSQVKDFIRQFLLKQPAVALVADLENINADMVPEKVRTMLNNGYNQKLSGDLQVVLKPGYLANWRSGTTHGSWNPYDSHIPLLWFGWHIPHGKSNREVYMYDIAPTVSALLSIQEPNGSVGHVIEEVVKH